MTKNDYLIEISENEHTDLGRVNFSEQSEPQQVFSAIWELEGQVNGGGFDQYFRNTEPDSIAHAPAALRMINAAACATLVEKALAHVFTSGLPTSQDQICEQLDALTEAHAEELDAIDQTFFEYPDNLTELLFSYVASHPNAFGPIPKGIENN